MSGENDARCPVTRPYKAAYPKTCSHSVTVLVDQHFTERTESRAKTVMKCRSLTDPGSGRKDPRRTCPNGGNPQPETTYVDHEAYCDEYAASEKRTRRAARERHTFRGVDPNDSSLGICEVWLDDVPTTKNVVSADAAACGMVPEVPEHRDPCQVPQTDETKCAVAPARHESPRGLRRSQLRGLAYKTAESSALRNTYKCHSCDEIAIIGAVPAKIQEKFTCLRQGHEDALAGKFDTGAPAGQPDAGIVRSLRALDEKYGEALTADQRSFIFSLAVTYPNLVPACSRP
jgi:hypothetical protein